MPDSASEVLDVSLVDVPASSGRGHGLIAWLVILAVVAGVVWRQHQSGADAFPDADSVDSKLGAIQGQVLVAATNAFGTPPDNADIEALVLGESARDRLRAAIVVGELRGVEQGAKHIEEIRQQWGPFVVLALAGGGPSFASLRPPGLEERHVLLLETLETLYIHYAKEEWAAPSVQAQERAWLRGELGWFGELALAPAGIPDQPARQAVLKPAYETLTYLAMVVGAAVLLGLAGFVGLVVLVVYLATGNLGSRFATGLPYAGIYAEMVAVWLLLYLGLSEAAQSLPVDSLLLLGSMVQLLSLSALAWPVLRGIPWQQVRHDLGLTLGRRPWLEPFLGLGTYAMAIPLAGLGVVITSILMKALGQPAQPPTHPIVEVVPRADAWIVLQIFVMACVLAPIVEEIIFRGALYRQLRETSRRWGRLASVLGSALLVSLVFAIIHPQGPLGVPPLAGLATAFSLSREWRGTLVPAMVAHGITNGVSLLGVLFLFGD